MNKNQLLALPQKVETWYFVIRKLHIWITPEDEPPTHPILGLILILETGLIRGLDTSPQGLTEKAALDILYKAMKRPNKGMGFEACRPKAIHFEDPALVEALAPKLAEIKVEAVHQPMTEAIDELVHELESKLKDDESEFPGLLSVRGVTPVLVGDLFTAAAIFYQAAPWVQLSDIQTLAITVPPERKERFVQVMGNGGIEYGLAIYKRWEDVERMYQAADHTIEVIPPGGGNSLFFDNASLLPPSDLDAIEQYGWEVAGNKAYPVPVIYTRSGGAKRPSHTDLLWYIAALYAIPIFVRDYLKPDGGGDYLPVQADISIRTHTGPATVSIKYPGGILEKEMHATGSLIWSDSNNDEDDNIMAFNPRAMEGMMRQFGGRSADQQLDKAQDLMYQAWEERNPAKRIKLAHQALSVSSNCADAYVLLAEEEADTVGRALEYYLKGVEAGVRALGKRFFKENKGHFWGILETRPYMRAREGLANTLWELGRPEEALEHFQEMLSLNPGDNQGIRYSMLNLLMDMGRDADAEKLIRQYEGDGFATWLYSRALLLYRKSGPTNQANAALEAALTQNTYVPAYLTARKRIPLNLPEYIGYGDENEAVSYASLYLSHWRRSPGAIEWLQSHLIDVGSKKTGVAPKKSMTKRSGRKKSM